MALPQTVSLAEYYDPLRSLADRFEELSDASEIPSHTDPRVNALVTGFVLKYLSDYLQIHTAEIPRLCNDVRKAIRDIEERDLQKVLFSTLLSQAPEGNSDVFGLQCLSDVRSTAALVKEIAFKKWNPERTQMFTGIDLGSGSGILSIAMAIAARRNQFSTIRLGLIDSQRQSLLSSHRVISQIPYIQTDCIQTDLVHTQLYTSILPPDFPVDYWVSETFGDSTPAIRSLTQSDCETDKREFWFADAFDPYISVLRNLLKYRSRFYHQVRSGSSAFFPDPINDCFRPNWQNGTVKLATSSRSETFVQYEDVKDDFMRLEVFGTPNVRWGMRDD